LINFPNLSEKECSTINFENIFTNVLSMAEGFELVSNDGVAFKADWLVVKQSNTLKTMLESFGIDKNSENLESIPLPKINSKVLGKILQYCNHHRNDPPYDETKPFLPDFITNWDAEFFDVDTTFLILLAEAANYLDIKSLSDALSYILISIMKGRSRDFVLRALSAASNNIFKRQSEAMEQTVYFFKHNMIFFNLFRFLLETQPKLTAELTEK
ncbi:E3 ubiquitin ligase complex SCF subunit sconC, partial [Trichinella sp. T9]